MIDIEPWLESDAPPDVAESLRAARTEAPRSAAVERCIALVGTAGAVGLSTSLASAASFGAGGKAVGSLAIVKWTLSGFALGALVVTGVEVTRRAVAPVPAEIVRAPSGALPSVPVEKPAVVAPEPRSERRSARSSGPEPASAPKSSASLATDERLAAELALLDRVRAAVDRRDATLAQALLSEHDETYGKSAPLSPEARYLRLEALELEGQGAEAEGVAREILARDPRGPHAARARAVLEKE